MFVNMATVEPRPSKEKDLSDNMKDFRDLLKPMPGLVNVYVLREESSGALVGLSIWNNKGSFEAAMAKISAAPRSSKNPEEFRLAPPTIRQFVEV